MTHGLRVRPFSTAFFATSAAASMTYGLEVLVQEVIAAIDDRAVVDLVRRAVGGGHRAGLDGTPLVAAGESEAGKDSLPASSLVAT